MTPKEYQQHAEKTACYPKSQGIEYCLLGLIGEITELCYASRANTKAELGDVAWYIAMLAKELGVELPDMFDADRLLNSDFSEEDTCIKSAFCRCGELANAVKKTIRDGKEVQKIMAEEKIFSLLDLFGNLCSLNGYTCNEVLQYNVEKLADRMSRNQIKGEGDNR